MPFARAAIVTSITDLEKLRLSVGSGPAVRGDVQGARQAVLPLEGCRHLQVGEVAGTAHQVRGDGRAVQGAVLPGLHRAGGGQGRRAAHGQRTSTAGSAPAPPAALPSGRRTRLGRSATRSATTSSTG